jgi:hypothetical protein
MRTRRYNDDLWLKLENAKVLAQGNPGPVRGLRTQIEQRIETLRSLIRAAESQAALLPGDPRPRVFRDPALEADLAREALADALELRRELESWRPRARGGEASGAP